MATKVKDLASKHFPGMGDEYHVGLANVGVTVVTATLAANTSQTDAQVIASPPNVALVPCGPIVHSLGTPPTASFMQLASMPAAGTGRDLQFQFITADNSAVYYRASSFTGTLPLGVSVQAVIIR